MTRSRITAAFAALALVGASVFGGSLVAASAAPAAPVITAPATGSVHAGQTPYISGTIDNPLGHDLEVNVWVTNAGGTFPYCDAFPYPPDSSGAWGCQWTDSTPLEVVYGDNTFFATATDPTDDPVTPSGSSNEVVITIGGTQEPTIFAPVDGDTVHDSTPLFEGTGPSLGTAHVYLGGENELCEAPIDASGYWNCASTVELPEGGPYGINVTAEYIDGTLSPAFTETINIYYVAPPPSPVITSPASGSTYDGYMTFTGTMANPDDYYYTVIVYPNTDGGTTCEDEILPGETTWSCDGFLLNDEMEYYAVAFDNDGEGGTSNPSFASNTVTLNYLGEVPLPTVNHSFGAASIGITASGPPGSILEIQFYEAYWNGEGYSYDTIAFCPTGGEGEGESNYGPTPVSCSFSDLAPGIYNAYTHLQIDDLESGYVDDYIMIPSTPTVDVAINDDRSVRFGGVGTAGYRVYVQNLSGDELCAATVNGSGAWACSAVMPTGTQSARAVQLSQGFSPDISSEGGTVRAFQGFSAFTGSVTVTVPAPPAPPIPVPTPTPTAPPVPLVWTFTAGGGEYSPGDTTDLVGKDLPPGSTVDAEFHSTPVPLGSTVVGPDGTFRLNVTIPEDASAGLHHFVVTVTPPGGAPSVVEQPVTIKVDPKTAGAPPSKDNLQLLNDIGGATGADRSDPAAPSSLTFSIAPVQQIVANPIVVGAAALAGLALLLLIAFPAELLNSTISEQYPRFSRRLPQVKAPWWERFTAALQSRPIFGAMLITLVASLIFGFSDPGFGFDITSVRLVLACFLALLVVGYLASSISGAIIRRRWGVATVMELKPLGLILTIIGVVISRLLDFSPGFLLGLLLGISIVGTSTLAQRAKATLVQAGVVFVLAMLGWLAYSFVLGATSPDTFGSALLFDTLVAVTAEGLTALFIGMLPFRFLDGESVFKYNKVIWAAAYALAAAAFVLIIVPSSWGEIDGPLWLWLAFVGGFAVIAIALYLYFRFWAPPLEEEDDEAEPAKEKVDA